MKTESGSRRHFFHLSVSVLPFRSDEAASYLDGQDQRRSFAGAD